MNFETKELLQLADDGCPLNDDNFSAEVVKDNHDFEYWMYGESIFWGW